MKQQPKLEVKSLKNHWVVFYKDGWVDLDSAHYLKCFSIKHFIESFHFNANWKEKRKEGYRCIKVNIEFKQVK